MKVKVRYFTILRELVGAREEELELKRGSILLELVEKVAYKYGEDAWDYLHVRTTGGLDPTIQFLINGVNARSFDGFKTKLKENDVVAIIPPVGGG